MPASAALARTHRAIVAELDALAAQAADRETAALRADRVSGWSVAEQLEHLMVSDRSILRALDTMLAGEKPSAGGGPSLAGRAILGFGYIPRGVGRAPKAVVPGKMEPPEIEAGFRELRQRYGALEKDLGRIERSDWTFPHPLLGNFDCRRWLRFVTVHHRHHQKIIRDIVAAARA